MGRAGPIWLPFATPLLHAASLYSLKHPKSRFYVRDAA
jgi:hypothetical protein